MSAYFLNATLHSPVVNDEPFIPLLPVTVLQAESINNSIPRKVVRRIHQLVENQVYTVAEGQKGFRFVS